MARKTIGLALAVLAAPVPTTAAEASTAATMLAAMREDGMWSQSEAQAWLDACAAAAPAASGAPGQLHIAAGCVASLYAHQAAEDVERRWRVEDLTIASRPVENILGVPVEAVLAPLVRAARPCPWDVPRGCQW